MEPLDVGVLIILGMGVFGGAVGGVLFQRFHIPQVVGYIAMGLIIGDLGLGLVTQEDVASLQAVNLFALGVIGFLVGGELRVDLFRKQGKRLFAILIGEGVAAFMLVGIAVGAVVYTLSQDLATATAAGCVFGAIASATDPASTLNVLWEYRSRGILTTTLIAIVALDDALAMALYGFGTATARTLTGDSASIPLELAATAGQLAGALALGAVPAGILWYIWRWLKRPEQIFVSAVGVLLLIIGVAGTLELDIILAAMALGITLINLAPARTETLLKTVRAFAAPIYVIFFVLVGARFNLSLMPPWLWGIVALYVLFRTAGKVGGAYAGARITGAAPEVQKYSGLGLFAQGGIAVGLSIMASHHLEGIPVTPQISLGDVIIYGITASTLAVQIIGPPTIKLASKLAGEMGRDVTEEDVIASWRVEDAMTQGIEPIRVQTPLSQVFQIFAANDHLVYPVADAAGTLRGVISLDDLKDVIVNQDTWDWVLANDVMVRTVAAVGPATSLAEALDKMRDLGVEEIPVVDEAADNRAVGILDQRAVRIRVNEEVLLRRGADPL